MILNNRWNTTSETQAFSRLPVFSTRCRTSGSSVLVRPLYMCVRGTGTETPDCGSWWLCIKQTVHWCYYRSSTANYLAVRSIITLDIAARGAADWTDGRPPNTRVVGGDLSAHKPGFCSFMFVLTGTSFLFFCVYFRCTCYILFLFANVFE